MLGSRRNHEKIRPWGVLVLYCLAGLIFCAFPPPAVGAAELKAELVNKIPEERTGDGGFYTGQVQLIFPDGHTQLLPYRSHLTPVVANGKVHIFVTEVGEINSIVIYDPAKGWGRSFPLPDDLYPFFSSPSFSPDGTKVAYYFPARQGHGYIDRKGKTVIPLTPYDRAGKFSQGLAPVEVRGRYGFIDTTGKMVIPPQFDGADDFSEGLARVWVRHNCGFIDRTGKIVIKPQYEMAHSFSEGLAWVKHGDLQSFIDQKGEEVIREPYNMSDQFSEGLVAAEIEKKWGYLDKAGAETIQAEYDLAGRFSEGLARVAVNGKYGFTDHAGKIIIPLQYDNALDFSEGLAVVKIGLKWGFTDRTGKMVIEPHFVWPPEPFTEGLAAVSPDGKLRGYIDKTGKMVIPPRFEYAGKFSQGLAAVRLGEEDYALGWGYIDKTGKMVIQPQFDNAGDFSEGLAAIRRGKEGFGGVRVRSWPDWRLFWESPVYDLNATDVPPEPPVWKTKSLVEFYPRFFDPPRFLKYQVPEPGGKDVQ